jgi:hypothetical protein
VCGVLHPNWRGAKTKGEPDNEFAFLFARLPNLEHQASLAQAMSL